MKLLVVNCSPRKNGNTDQIAKNLIKIFEKENINFNELILRDIEMKLPDGCTECANSNPCPNTVDEFSEKIMSKIPNYDSFIFITPVHDDNVTVLMKIFIDRIVSFCNKKKMYLKNKKIGLIAHGMSGIKSWKIPIKWIKNVSSFHNAKFVGYHICYSNSEPNTSEIKIKELQKFIKKFLN